MVARFVCPASRLPEIEGEELRLSVVVDVEQLVLDDRVEAVEGRDADALAPLGHEAYLELPLDRVAARVKVAEARGMRVKVRCGPAPPPIGALAEFIHACREAGVPFKATAGLHHAVRTDGQHGFVNLLAAVVFGDEEAALAEDDAGAFSLGDSFRWRERKAGSEELARARRELFTSIGSCSFTEPVEELRALGWL
jgi:hypothetical protein